MTKNRIVRNVKSDYSMLMKIWLYQYAYKSIKEDDLIRRFCWIWTKSERLYQSNTFSRQVFFDPDRDIKLKTTQDYPWML